MHISICHTKTGCKFFVIVIPKGDLAGTFFFLLSDNSIMQLYSVVLFDVVLFDKGRLGWAGVSQALFWYDSDKDLRELSFFARRGDVSEGTRDIVPDFRRTQRGGWTKLAIAHHKQTVPSSSY